MADLENKSHGTQPPPPLAQKPAMPRHHHHAARDDSSVWPADMRSSHSSGESRGTDPTDPKKWFDRSNRNPVATLDPNQMDVDTPFFQRETDSSNEGVPDLRGASKKPTLHLPSHHARQMSLFGPAIAHSSSADDYRSVIDDLTVENKRLREELRRYKQAGPDVLRKDKLFEIKVHRLPKHKKRELDATLRGFAASLDGSVETDSSRRESTRPVPDTDSGASKSTHSRPVDSAYASMSTAPSSAAPNNSSRAPAAAAAAALKPPILKPPPIRKPDSTRSNLLLSSDHKVENYLHDTPHGLLPRHIIMSDKERKKLVVRRLEQLFTGKIGGRAAQRSRSAQPLEKTPELTPADAPESTEGGASREARIQPLKHSRKKDGRFHDSNSNSNSGDRTTESGGNGGGNGSGEGSGSGSGRSGNGKKNNNATNTAATTTTTTTTTKNISPTTTCLPPEQRATSALDLDPDRVQVPSENMEYIRHLGLDPDKTPGGKKTRSQDVSPDADGWVYLNLLCNLAQLHMINVTPSFIRAAVSAKSAKFQLSPDGKKIRWRGGTDGTKFSSDSSGDGSQKSPSTDGTTDEPNNEGGGRRKRQKTSASGGGGGLTSVSSSKDSKSGPHAGSASTATTDNFHYKPIIVRQSSSLMTSLIGSGSQASSVEAEDSKPGKDSHWGFHSGTGSSQRRKRRHDGAIIYYSGAPFCTDLSGDPVELPRPTIPQPTKPAGQTQPSDPPALPRTLSGSSIPIRPLTDDREAAKAAMGPGDSASVEYGEGNDEEDEDEDDSDSDDDGMDLDDDGFQFPWSDEPDQALARPMESVCLEPSGLGGVVPDDHFAVAVTTRRPICHPANDALRAATPDAAESIARRLAGMTTTSPVPPPSRPSDGGYVHARAHPHPPPVGVGYLSGRLRRLKPVSLPQPSMFFPPFRSDSDSDAEDDGLDSGDEEDSDQDLVSEGLTSQRVNPHRSDVTYPDGPGLSSENGAGEEAEEEEDDEDDDDADDDEDDEDEDEDDEAYPESESSLSVEE